MEAHNAHDRKWYLASKVLTSSLTPEEQTEWEALKDDLLFQEDFARVKLYWEKLQTLPYRQIDPGNDWKIVMEKIRQHDEQFEPVNERRSWLRYAAAISVLVMASALVWWATGSRLFTDDSAHLTTIVAPAGSKTLVTLPDQSTVWLNAGSRVSFDNRFGMDNRNVTLEGEAFFDVIKSKVPFNVHTDIFDIAVLGTAFNIRAYKDDDRATATLVRGSLKVKRQNISGAQHEILLVPNDRLTLYRNEGTPAAAPAQTAFSVKVDQKINAERETSWKDGWLSIEGESLGELAVKLERLYDIKIRFTEDALKTYRFTGRIRQLSLEQVLKALSLTSPVEFSIDEKQVTLSENKRMKSKYKSLQMP